jgi:DNA invertase Pin-like site-specific DNA recombinase
MPLKVEVIEPKDSVAKRRVVALIRVSTAEQGRDDRGGIPRQRSVIEDTIRRKNLECLRIYEIHACSGTEVLRNPEIQEILKIVSTGVGLVVADLDRLFRPTEPADYVILQVFKDSGSIIFSGETEYNLADKDSALFASMRSAYSAYEIQLFKDRVHKTNEGKRREGKCPTNKLTWPLGLSFDRETQKWIWNERAPDVAKIFQSFLEDTANYSELGRRFNLTSATIRNTLSRRIYATGERIISQKRGEKRFSRTGNVYRAKVNRAPRDVIKVKIINPIIPIEQFNLVQQRISETRFNHHESRKRGEVFNYGAGVARCGHCSEIFLYSSGKRRTGQRGSQAFCKRNYYLYRDKLGGCRQPNLRSPDLDSLIDAFTTSILRDAGTLARVIDQSLQRTREVVHQFPQPTVESQLAALQKKSIRILEAYESGILTLEELRSRRDALKVKVASLQRRPEHQETSRDISVEEFARKVVRGAFRFKRMMDRREKKAVILSLFSEIYVKDRSVIAFKFRENFVVGDQETLGAGFSTPPIHLPEPFTLEPADPLPEGTRRCSCCRTIFPTAEFYPRKGQCRRCIAVKAHEAYLRRRSVVSA